MKSRERKLIIFLGYLSPLRYLGPDHIWVGIDLGNTLDGACPANNIHSSHSKIVFTSVAWCNLKVIECAPLG